MIKLDKDKRYIVKIKSQFEKELVEKILYRNCLEYSVSKDLETRFNEKLINRIIIYPDNRTLYYFIGKHELLKLKTMETVELSAFDFISEKQSCEKKEKEMNLLEPGFVVPKNEEESELIQKVLFERGYGWGNCLIKKYYNNRRIIIFRDRYLSSVVCVPLCMMNAIAETGGHLRRLLGNGLKQYTVGEILGREKQSCEKKGKEMNPFKKEKEMNLLEPGFVIPKNEEESELIQKALFVRGYGWSDHLIQQYRNNRRIIIFRDCCLSYSEENSYIRRLLDDGLIPYSVSEILGRENKVENVDDIKVKAFMNSGSVRTALYDECYGTTEHKILMSRLEYREKYGKYNDLVRRHGNIIYENVRKITKTDEPRTDLATFEPDEVDRLDYI